MELARRARRAKARLGLGIVDSVREAELLGNRRTWAISEGLDPEGVAEIFDAVLRVSRRAQRQDT
jgi:prephenate dehydrogenase